MFPIYLYIALFLLVALLSTRIMKLLKLPNVTGYIITGILIGPFVFGLCFNNFSFEGIKDSLIYSYVEKISWVSSLALGFIAFSIGTSFKKSTLVSVGKRAIIITIFEAFGGSLLVIAALLVAHYVDPIHVSIQLVLTLSAIASATAPAATLMVIKQYKAKGSLVNTLLPVVALDDAAALILFAILFQLAKGLSTNEYSIYNMIAKPLLEILISIGVGTILGIVIVLLNKLFKSRNNRLVLCIFTVFAGLGIYFLFRNEFMGGFELSSLLMCMASGVIYVNFTKDNEKTYDVLDKFTSPLYIVFFVISGAQLDLSIFASKLGIIVIVIASIYIVFRVIGKWLGAYVGASITKSEPKIKKYLGFTLVPQAGVAIGLSTTACKLFNEIPGMAETGNLILAIILSSTLVYELVGPFIAKFALVRAGEIEKE